MISSSSIEEHVPRLGRLARQTLTHIAIGLSCSLVILTLCCYLEIKKNLTEMGVKILEKYVEQNRDLENLPFHTVQMHQELLKGLILQELSTKLPEKAIEVEFNRLYATAPDGAWRNRPEIFDGKKEAGLLIPVGVVPGSTLKQQLLVAGKACQVYGNAWQFDSINTYFMTPQSATVIFWPMRPKFSFALPPNLDLTKQIFYSVATPENDPERKTVWTDMYLDPFAKIWMCSAATPIYDHDTFIGTIGSDLLLKDLISRIHHDSLAGSYTFVVRKNGILVMHPQYTEQISEAHGEFRVPDTHDEQLQDFYQVALGQLGKNIVTESSNHRFHLGVAYLKSPDWIMITVFPHTVINAVALHGAKSVLIPGVIVLSLSLVFVYFILWSKIGRPLRAMTKLTREVADGNLTAKLDLPRTNELGEVATSLNLMMEKLAEREATLQANMIEKEKANKRILEAQKLESLSVLAGGISHDFSNLLTGIIGNTCIARSELGRNSPLQDFLNKIEDCARRAAELCKQMLAYSGKGRFQISRLQLSELIESTSELLRVSIHMDSKLTFKLSEDLPPISADATQVQQLLVNLVINASEAIGQKEGVIYISTGRLYLSHVDLQEYIHWPNVTPGDYVLLEVHDTGEGMSPEIMSKIFDPFFSTKFTGRGLGLAAVLGIVRGHKGAIQVRSKPGFGCTFRVLFPATSGKLDTPTTQSPQVESDEWKAQGLALIVDDENPVREVSTRMMQKIGFRTITATDGREALAQFKTHSADLTIVLMDLTMPHLDGLAAFTEIHHERPDLPVIIMSGYNEKEAIGHQTNRGISGFLQKPFDLNALRNKVYQVLQGNKPGV